MFEPLPTLIRLQREALGLTIDALSALAGVSRTRLITLEKGDDNISLELLVKVANALQMSELRIGGLRVTAATQNFKEKAVAAEAIEVARKVAQQAAGALAEIDRVAGPVYEALAPVITKRVPASGAEAGPKAAVRKRAGQRR